MPVPRASKKNVQSGRPRRKSFIAQIVLVLLGIELLFLSGFTALNLPTATKRNLEVYSLVKAGKLYSKFSRKFKQTCQQTVPNMIPPEAASLPALRYSLYVPQAPVTIFLSYVLGWPLALIAVLGYLLLGLVGPIFKVYVFAAGNDAHYYLQPGFGYLIGLAVAAGCVGWISRGERRSLNQILSLFLGLVCVHVVGLAYLIGICLFGALNENTGQQIVWSRWLFEEARNLTWYALPYDCLFALFFIGIAFPFRWLVNILTAPDIGAGEAASNEKLVDFKLAR